MKTMYIIYCALITLAAFSAPASADCNIVGDAKQRQQNYRSGLSARTSDVSRERSPRSRSADVSGDGRISSPDAFMTLSMAQKTQVCVNAPEVVLGTFNVTMDVYSVVDLDSGQFDLSFDSSVVNVIGVNAGNIGGTTVPLVDWRFMDEDTIKVLFKLYGDDGVSGSGYVAKIGFETTGSGTSILDLFDGKLADTSADEIPATWTDDEVTV